MTPASTLPLAGVRVLSCEQFLAGPYGSMLLASFGADVIRVERPPEGEVTRSFEPAAQNERGRTAYGMLANNLNKRSLGLDIQSEEGREIFRQLVREVDVVWQNLRPGTLDKMGLGYEDLKKINPRIVYVSISGYGQKWTSGSPYTSLPAFDIMAQAMGGLMMRPGREGDAPVFSGYALGDQYPGVLAALGCAMALRGRDQTGVGQHVDISMYDATASLLSLNMAQHAMAPGIARRGKMASTAPYGAYAASDGYFIVACGTEAIWHSLCGVLERPDLLADPTLQSGRDRSARADDLRVAIEDWARAGTVEECVKVLLKAGVPSCKVQDLPDLLECPHLEARDMLPEIDDPVAGKRKVLGVPIRFSDAPARHNAPPQFGQHTDEVLAELGLSAQQIHAMREAGVVA